MTMSVCDSFEFQYLSQMPRLRQSYALGSSRRDKPWNTPGRADTYYEDGWREGPPNTALVLFKFL
jgi:hypothetical protein